MNGGDMWWDGVNVAEYEFPKIIAGSGHTPRNVGFLNSIWLSGYDDNGDLKVSAQRYRNIGFDFWPGPLSNGTIDSSICSKFDRFFEVYKTEAITHSNNINSMSLPLSLNSIATNIKEWPAKGNQYLATTYNIQINDDLAPFNDSNNNGFYDPENGDCPIIKGDQCIFWVINDLGNTHSNSGGEPLGVEIQCMAYSYITTDAVNNATFYDYKIIKKTNGNISDFYFSQCLDPDIMSATDDYIGCDTLNNYGYCYTTDIGCFGPLEPPIFINQFVNNELSSFIYYNNDNTIYGYPHNPTHYRNYQLAKWKDGTHLTSGGYGLDTLNLETNFVYPGNPAINTEWSECSNQSSPADRRYIMSTGPFELKQNIALEFTTASIIVQHSTVCFNRDIILNPTIEFINNFIDTVNNNHCDNILSVTDFQDQNSFVDLFPNPASDKISIKLDESFELTSIEIYDVKGSKISFDINDKILDLKDFSKGIYNMKLYSEKLNKIIVKKFLVE